MPQDRARRGRACRSRPGRWHGRRSRRRTSCPVPGGGRPSGGARARHLGEPQADGEPEVERRLLLEPHVARLVVDQVVHQRLLVLGERLLDGVDGALLHVQIDRGEDLVLVQQLQHLFVLVAADFLGEREGGRESQVGRQVHLRGGGARNLEDVFGERHRHSSRQPSASSGAFTSAARAMTASMVGRVSLTTSSPPGHSTANQNPLGHSATKHRRWPEARRRRQSTSASPWNRPVCWGRGQSEATRLAYQAERPGTTISPRDLQLRPRSVVREPAPPARRAPGPRRDRRGRATTPNSSGLKPATTRCRGGSTPRSTFLAEATISGRRRTRRWPRPG